MKFENGEVLVSKDDCKSLRFVMGCNTDLSVKLTSRCIDKTYYKASSIVKCMINNQLLFTCNAEEFNNLLNDTFYQFDLTIKMLKGDYDYE